jgi:UDP-glucose 4-epimerase
MHGRPKDIEHHQVDLRSKKARDIFRTGEVDALIHLGVMHDPRARPSELYSWNIGGTTKLLEYCQAYRVPKVVLLSSANVYGPRPDNPQFLTEEPRSGSRRCAISSRSTTWCRRSCGAPRTSRP